MNAQELKLDYFKIYDVKNHSVEYPVILQGQFDEEAPKEAQLVDLTCFASPVRKNREPIYDPKAHLTWYRLHQPAPEKYRKVVVANQFGRRQIISIGQPRALLVPAQKQSKSRVFGVELFPVTLSHFKLYDAQWVAGEPLSESPALEDQFGSEEATVRAPLYFGVPVQKTYRGVLSPIHNGESHLVIYRIGRRVLDPPPTRAVRDQFGGRDLAFLASIALAVPSRKLDWEEL